MEIPYKGYTITPSSERQPDGRWLPVAQIETERRGIVTTSPPVRATSREMRAARADADAVAVRMAKAWIDAHEREPTPVGPSPAPGSGRARASRVEAARPAPAAPVVEAKPVPAPPPSAAPVTEAKPVPAPPRPAAPVTEAKPAPAPPPSAAPVTEAKPAPPPPAPSEVRAPAARTEAVPRAKTPSERRRATPAEKPEWADLCQAVGLDADEKVDRLTRVLVVHSLLDRLVTLVLATKIAASSESHEAPRVEKTLAEVGPLPMPSRIAMGSALGVVTGAVAESITEVERVRSRLALPRPTRGRPPWDVGDIEELASQAACDRCVSRGIQAAHELIASLRVTWPPPRE